MSISNYILIRNNKTNKCIDTNDLFYNSFKYLDDLLTSLEVDCPRAYRFLDPYLNFDNGYINLYNKYSITEGDIKWSMKLNEINLLVSQIKLVLLDDSFSRELNKVYEYGKSYKDELFSLAMNLSKINNYCEFKKLTEKYYNDILVISYII